MDILDLLLDLDNTMYPETSEIFTQVDIKMKEFISKKLKVNLEKAYIIQKKYFRENGTTLRGLMINNNIKPEPFLSFVHDIDLKSIKKDFRLKKLLNTYPGKKIIFTNGTFKHAQNILKKIGVYESIDAIFDIVNAKYIPKPDEAPYINILKKYRLTPSNTVMFDDLPQNLFTAKKLGLKTVLIKKNNKKKYTYIDHVNCDISKAIIKLINKEIF